MSQGEPPAGPVSFEDLYAEHGPRVQRLLVRLGLLDADREDVAQEVWTIVHRSLPSYDARKGTARAWIAGIARNAARAYLRKQERRPEDVTPEDQEPPELHVDGPDMGIAEARQRAALWAFVQRSIPNEDQREALLLHEIEGLTVEEVATITGARVWTAQWRIRMARSKLKAAQEKLTEEEREKLRAVVLPLGGVDGILRALRDAPVSDEEVARVWDRVTARIEAEGGSIHDRLGTPETAPNPAPPKGYTITGPRLASAAAAVFLLGALSGAAGHALLTRPVRAEMNPIEAEIAPAPLSPVAPAPEPIASTSAVPSTSAAPSSSIASPAWEPERAILERARTALVKGAPQQALDQANKHARLFPQSSAAATREEIAIRALVQLGRRAEAEERAAKLVQWAPQRRPAMEAMLGRSFL